MQYAKGVDTVPFTIKLYQERGMAYFGGGLNLADAKSPLLVTHNGNQLAFIGCNAPGPIYAWATEDQAGAAPCGDYQWMVDIGSPISKQLDTSPLRPSSITKIITPMLVII